MPSPALSRATIRCCGHQGLSKSKFLRRVVVATNRSFHTYVATCFSTRVVSHLRWHLSRSSRAYAREQRTPTESIMEKAVRVCHCSGQRRFNEPCSRRKQDVTRNGGPQTCGWKTRQMGNTLNIDVAWQASSDQDDRSTLSTLPGV